jgi:CDP-diacylglycerol--glycerol-3-phosphate 3-phosphatidyltransferase
MTNLLVPPDSAAAVPANPGLLPVGPFATVPNVVTATRTAIAVVLGAIAVATGDLRLLAVAYAVFWVGDIADGWSARKLGQETRAGAVFDIVCDRACTGILCVGLVASVPSALPVVVVFVLSFMVLDSMLSMAFLCWPVLSPNYFHFVDRRVWQLNWSPMAKAANTAGVVGALALELFSVALVVAVVVLGIKLWSARRVIRLLAAEGR